LIQKEKERGPTAVQMVDFGPTGSTEKKKAERESPAKRKWAGGAGTERVKIARPLAKGWPSLRKESKQKKKVPNLDPQEVLVNPSLGHKPGPKKKKAGAQTRGDAVSPTCDPRPLRGEVHPLWTNQPRPPEKKKPLTGRKPGEDLG